jgi:hypothetical protein
VKKYSIAVQAGIVPELPIAAPVGGVSAGWLYIGNSTHIQKKNFNKHTPTPLLLKQSSKKFKK